jgi:Tfp pilus assembly protein PilF
LANDPADAPARQQLIAVLLQSGNAAAQEERFGEAAASYRELIALEPQNADYRNNFGLLLARSGDLAAAAAQFEAALAINPTHQAARRNLNAMRQRR